MLSAPEPLSSSLGDNVAGAFEAVQEDHPAAGRRLGAGQPWRRTPRIPALRASSAPLRMGVIDPRLA